MAHHTGSDSKAATTIPRMAWPSVALRCTIGALVTHPAACLGTPE
jgi:hypothetical protein